MAVAPAPLAPATRVDFGYALSGTSAAASRSDASVPIQIQTIIQQHGNAIAAAAASWSAGFAEGYQHGYAAGSRHGALTPPP
jgi:hypothetical protein